MAVRSSASPSRPMNDLMRSVADIPGDADDDLPEISPELVLVDPELARLVREDAAAAAAAAPSRDRALRLVRGAPRVDDRVDDAEPAEQVIVPRPAVTEGSHHVGERERDSQVENDELIVPRAIEPTESSATAGSEPAVEAPAASQAVVAGAEPASELLPGVVPTASEPVVEVPTASQAVVAEAEPAPGLVPGAVSMVSEPVVEAPSASRAVVPTPAVVVDVGSESELVPGVVPTVSEPDGEREEAEEPSSPGTIVVPTTVSPVGEPASEITAHAIPVVARRVVDAEPARVVAPRPAVSAFPVTVPEPAEMAPEPRTRAILTPAMPHPIVRPGEPTRAPVRTTRAAARTRSHRLPGERRRRVPRRARDPEPHRRHLVVRRPPAVRRVGAVVLRCRHRQGAGERFDKGEGGREGQGSGGGEGQGSGGGEGQGAGGGEGQGPRRRRRPRPRRRRGQGEGGEGEGGEGKGREGKGSEGCGDREGGERCQGGATPTPGGRLRPSPSHADSRGRQSRGRSPTTSSSSGEPSAFSRRRRRNRSSSSGRRGASRANWCTSTPGDVPLVRLAGHEDRTRHSGRRPGEALHPVTGFGLHSAWEVG